MGLRFKVFSSFMILSMMLFLAGVWSIHQMKTIGRSAHGMLEDNYKSIDAGRAMIEALEREDSGILVLLLGRWEEGRAQVESADLEFRKNLEQARRNVTLTRESEAVERVADRYRTYENLWKRPIVGTPKEGNLDWYIRDVHPSFLQVKSAVKTLVEMNENAMYRTATSLKDQANRAMMPGIVAMLAALVFSLLSYLLIHRFVLGPILGITRGVDEFVRTGKPFDVRPETRDEIGRLASAIEDLCAAAGGARKKS